MNNLNLVIIIMIVIFILFHNNDNEETFNIKDKNTIDKPINKKKYREHKKILIRENDLETDYYIDKILSENGPERCPQPVKNIKEFNKDFFKFRDYTNNNTSITADPIDKINNLRLTGDLENSNKYPDMKIKDIYDHVTSGIDLYSKKCVRYPYFDNTMHDGYNYDFLTGMHNVRDNWLYNNEQEINGGQYDVNLYGYYPEELKQLPVLHN